MKPLTHVPVRASQITQFPPRRRARALLLTVGMKEQLSRQLAQTPAQLGTAGPFGKLLVGCTPLLLRLGKVVGKRSNSWSPPADDAAVAEERIPLSQGEFPGRPHALAS